MRLLTTGMIAEHLHADRDRVSYLLRKARIQPVCRAGMVRLYGPEIVPVIRELLGSKRIQASEIELVLARYPMVVA